MGTATVYENVAEAAATLRMTKAVPAEWADKIRKDYEKRGGRR